MDIVLENCAWVAGARLGKALELAKQQGSRIGEDVHYRRRKRRSWRLAAVYGLAKLMYMILQIISPLKRHFMTNIINIEWSDLLSVNCFNVQLLLVQ